MRFFKRLAGIACAVLALGFAGCANDDDDDDSGNTGNSGSSSAVTKTAPDAVGDIVLSDGTAVAAENAASMSDAQKAAAVAVIFYAGSADDALGEKVLGVGLQNTRGESTTTLAWYTSSAEGYSTNITALQCTQTAAVTADTATFTGTTDGSGSWATLCAAVSDEDTSGNYPAWEWVNAYVANNGLSSTSYAENWYLPSIAELTMLYRAKATVNASLAAAGGTKISRSSYYWSSSQSASNDGCACNLYFGSGFLGDFFKSYSNLNGVCCVRAFN